MKRIVLSLMIMVLAGMALAAQRRILSDSTYHSVSAVTQPYSTWTSTTQRITFDRNPASLAVWTAEDFSGLGHDLTNSKTAQRPAPSSGKVWFDGTNDYLTRATWSVSQTKQCTAMWIKTTQSTGPRTLMWGFSDYIGFYLNKVTAGKVFYFVDGSSADASGNEAATIVNDGRWHHIMGVNNGSTTTHYIDGVGMNSRADTLTWNATAENVGSYDTGKTYNVQADIDDFTIFNRALTAAEVTNFYFSSGRQQHKIHREDSLASGDFAMSSTVYGGYIWTACPDDDTFEKRDLMTGAKLDELNLGASSTPSHSIGIDDTMWVTCQGSDTVAVVDIATADLDEMIDVGDTPRGLATDGTNVWCANWNDTTVSKIDIASRTVLTNIVLGSGVRPFRPEYDNNGYVWCTDLTNASTKVFRIKVSDSSVTNFTTVPGKQSWDARLIGTTQMWVSCVNLTNQVYGCIDIYNTLTGAKITTLTPPGTTFYPHEIEPVGNTAWTTSASDDKAYAFDIPSLTYLWTVPVGDDPAGVVWDGDYWLWVTCALSDNIVRIWIP